MVGTAPERSEGPVFWAAATPRGQRPCDGGRMPSRSASAKTARALSILPSAHEHRPAPRIRPSVLRIKLDRFRVVRDSFIQI